MLDFWCLEFSATVHCSLPLSFTPQCSLPRFVCSAQAINKHRLELCVLELALAWFGLSGVERRREKEEAKVAFCYSMQIYGRQLRRKAEEEEGTALFFFLFRGRLLSQF